MMTDMELSRTGLSTFNGLTSSPMKPHRLFAAQTAVFLIQGQPSSPSAEFKIAIQAAGWVCLSHSYPLPGHISTACQDGERSLAREQGFLCEKPPESRC